MKRGSIPERHDQDRDEGGHRRHQQDAQVGVDEPFDPRIPGRRQAKRDAERDGDPNPTKSDWLLIKNAFHLRVDDKRADAEQRVRERRNEQQVGDRAYVSQRPRRGEDEQAIGPWRAEDPGAECVERRTAGSTTTRDVILELVVLENAPVISGCLATMGARLAAGPWGWSSRSRPGDPGLPWVPDRCSIVSAPCCLPDRLARSGSLTAEVRTSADAEFAGLYAAAGDRVKGNGTAGRPCPA